MALQASGAISINDLVAEFGGSAPDGLEEYYRGGGLVPDNGTNAGVPTSGTITLEDFYSASGDDVIMDALTWSDTVIGPATETVTATISGIDATISIKFVSNATFGSMTFKLNAAFKSNNTAFDAENGDVLSIIYTVVNGTTGSKANGSIAITNITDEDTVVSGSVTANAYSDETI